MPACKVNTMPAYSFWQMYEAGLVHLQWFAVRILAVVTSAGAPERFFSKLKWMKDSRRNRLSHMKTEKVLRLHYNMRLLERAKKLDIICSRPRNTLKESMVKDMLDAVEVEDILNFDDDVAATLDEIEDMNIQGEDELAEELLDEEDPDSPQ